jgi:hypothetical protein
MRDLADACCGDASGMSTFCTRVSGGFVVCGLNNEGWGGGCLPGACHGKGHSVTGSQGLAAMPGVWTGLDR